RPLARRARRRAAAAAAGRLRLVEGVGRKGARRGRGDRADRGDGGINDDRFGRQGRRISAHQNLPERLSPPIVAPGEEGMISSRRENLSPPSPSGGFGGCLGLDGGPLVARRMMPVMRPTPATAVVTSATPVNVRPLLAIGIAEGGHDVSPPHL